MNEIDKLAAGLEYNLSDPYFKTQKMDALRYARALNEVDRDDAEATEAAVRALFGPLGENPTVYPGFHCDCGKNITAGDGLVINFNVSILDRAPVTLGDHVLIGPGCVLSTVNHPITPKRRRENYATAKPITLGNDVWLGANVTVLPGITIGNNVIIAAGAVVTKDVPDNCIMAGVPAKFLRDIEDDLV